MPRLRSPSCRPLSSSSPSSSFSSSSFSSYWFTSNGSSRSSLPLMLICFLLISCFLPAVHSIQFFLKQGEEICLSEDANVGDLIVGEFTLSPSGSRIQVYLTDPSGNQVYAKLVSTNAADEVAKFAHTSSRGGEYRACFINSDGMNQKTVGFQFRVGVGGEKEEKEVGGVAKKESLKPIERELKRLEETVTQIANEMKYMSTREDARRGVNDSTGSQVVWFSATSLLLLVALKAAEIWYLRRYFHSKRLI